MCMQIAADKWTVFIIISMNIGLNGKTWMEEGISVVLKHLEKFGFAAETNSS